MTLQEISDKHRVAIKTDACGDKIIPGSNGHLSVEYGKIYICYTDDGRKRPHTAKRKGNTLRRLGDSIQVIQNGDCEFVGIVKPGAVGAALRELGVRKKKSLSEETIQNLKAQLVVARQNRQLSL